MPEYILFGYPHNHFTEMAKELLEEQKIQYEFRAAPDGVHPNGTNPFRLTRVPAIRHSDALETHIADGIDELREWLKELPA